MASCGSNVKSQSGQNCGDCLPTWAPICPDVVMAQSPFFEVEEILLRPTTLQRQSFIRVGDKMKWCSMLPFYVSPSQAAQISSDQKQVMVRFCGANSTGEQGDFYPFEMEIYVNGRSVTVKRPPTPVNISGRVIPDPQIPNFVEVRWPSGNLAVSIYVVKPNSSEDLFQQLKKKQLQPPDFTIGRIKEIIASEMDDVAAPTSIRFTLTCPLGLSRMTYPCRAITCKHLQCFDAKTFLTIMENRPNLRCPICNGLINFQDLRIDGYFMDVIQNHSFDASNEIELYADGHWEPVQKLKPEPAHKPKSRREKFNKSSSALGNAAVDLDDDDDIKVIKIVKSVQTKAKRAPTSSSSSKFKRESQEVEVIDLVSDDDEPQMKAEETEVRPGPSRPNTNYHLAIPSTSGSHLGECSTYNLRGFLNAPAPEEDSTFFPRTFFKSPADSDSSSD